MTSQEQIIIGIHKKQANTIIPFIVAIVLSVTCVVALYQMQHITHAASAQYVHNTTAVALASAPEKVVTHAEGITLTHTPSTIVSGTTWFTVTTDVPYSFTSWDFGDGTTQLVTGTRTLAMTDTVYITHIYTRTGNYTITVELLNKQKEPYDPDFILTTNVSVKPDMTVTATPDRILTIGGDSAVIMAQLRDAQGKPLPRQSVTFSTSLGTLDRASAETNAHGIITATLVSDTAGTATVTAHAGGATQSVEVTVVQPVIHATMSSQTTMFGDDTTFSFDINAEDININYTHVQWNFGDGTIVTDTNTTDTHVSHELAAATTLTKQHTYETIGQYTTTVTLLRDGVVLLVSNPMVVTITPELNVTMTNQFVPVGYGHTTNITATVKKANGTAVTSQTVSFSTTLGYFGTLSNTMLLNKNTNSQGVVTATLASYDGGTAQVDVRVGTATRSITVTFVPNILLPITMKIDPPPPIPGSLAFTTPPAADIRLGETTETPLAVTLKDTRGRVFPHQTITFATTIGSVTPATATTNANGVASTTLIPPNDDLGEATITAKVDGIESVSAEATTEFLIRLCNDIEDANDSTLRNPQPPFLNALNHWCQGSHEEDPVGEDDYYKLSISGTKTVHIQVSHMTVGANYDLYLYNDTDIPPIGKSQNAGSSSESISKVLQSGDYYIGIRIVSKAPGDDIYHLKVTVQ